MSQRIQLHRALSKLGICSRKQAIQLIVNGNIKLQGQIITEPLTWINLAEAVIEKVDKPGEPSIKTLSAKPQPLYLAMHKPMHIMTTRQDEKKRKTVYDLLPAKFRDAWLFPIGRLDQDSEGLLLFTNDGVFADRILDPEHHIPKIYHVQLNRLPSPAELIPLRHGMQIGPLCLQPIAVKHTHGHWFQVELHEGKNRQIRRMFQAIGYKVTRLIRLAIGPVELGTLPTGSFRKLTAEEKKQLALV